MGVWNKFMQAAHSERAQNATFYGAMVLSVAGATSMLYGTYKLGTGVEKLDDSMGSLIETLDRINNKPLPSETVLPALNHDGS